FPDFLPEGTTIWLKDYRETLDLIEKGFLRAEEAFAEILKSGGNTQVVFKPADLFDSEKTFASLLERFHRVEFGNRFYLKPEAEHQLGIKPQPHFHKNFNLLAE